MITKAQRTELEQLIKNWGDTRQDMNYAYDNFVGDAVKTAMTIHGFACTELFEFLNSITGKS